jgi:hypothetical protein
VGGLPRTNIKSLVELRTRFDCAPTTADGCGFGGAKAYKVSKMALAMTSRLLRTNIYKNSGFTFSSADPAYVANMPLFWEEVPWFRQYLPIGAPSGNFWLLLRNDRGGGGYFIPGRDGAHVGGLLILWHDDACGAILGDTWILHKIQSVF